MDMDTVYRFFFKVCVPAFAAVMIGVGYYGSGMSAGDTRMRVESSCKEVRGNAIGTVTVTRGNKSQQFKC